MRQRCLGLRSRFAGALTAMLVLSSLEAESRASDEVGKDSFQVTPSTLQATIDEAAKAFAARQFAQARILFQRSAKQATDPETKRELFFNAGVCAFEQANYYAAEQHFLQAAAIAPADAAGRFYVHAGLAAVRLGDVDRASVHLSRANEAIQTKLAEELATSIERRRNETARQTRENTIHSYLQKSEQARRDSDWKAEREALRQALQLAPELVDLNVAIGASLAQSGDYVAAERTLTEALGLPLGQKAQTVALASLDALYPVPPSGVRVGLGLSSGFDTNASASPAAERRGVFTQGGDSLDPTRTRVSSILTKADLNVAYSWRWARQWALVPALRVQAAWFARQAVRRLSLTTTDLGLALYHAPSVATQLSAGIGSTLLVLDWLPKTAFLSEVYAEVGTLFRLSPAWSTLFSLRAAPAQGYGQHKDLSGGSLALQLGGQWTTSFVNTTLLLSGFASRAGKQNIPASETAVPACSPESLERPILCDRAHFEVPLSYFKPEIALNVQVTPWKPLVLSFAVRAFSRRFGEPSVVRVEPNDVVLAASEKVRRDRGLEFGVGAEVFPTATRTWSLFTQHTLLVHRSNLAPDAQAQDHRFDYEDHNYNKYVAQLGVRANFW